MYSNLLTALENYCTFPQIFSLDFIGFGLLVSLGKREVRLCLSLAFSTTVLYSCFFLQFLPHGSGRQWCSFLCHQTDNLVGTLSYIQAEVDVLVYPAPYLSTLTPSVIM